MIYILCGPYAKYAMSLSDTVDLESPFARGALRKMCPSDLRVRQ